MHHNKILIEFGSNTAKLFVPHPQDAMGKSYVFPLRLADSLDFSNALIPAKIDEMVSLINTIRAQHPSAKLHLIATQALRSASNQAQIVRNIRERTALNLHILSPYQEAKAAFLGSTHTLNLKGATLIFDIGGGSTELIFGKTGSMLSWQSFSLGALSLARKYHSVLPYEEQSQAELEVHIKSMNLPPIEEDFCLVGCGGSVNTALDLARAQGSVAENCTMLSADEILRQFRQMRPLSKEQIAAIAGMEPSRADIMPAALSLILRVLNIANKDSFTVSHAGVRQGYFFL